MFNNLTFQIEIDKSKYVRCVNPIYVIATFYLNFLFSLLQLVKFRLV